MPLLEPEVAGEAAAAGVEHLRLDAERGHDRAVVVVAELGVLVAVHLDERLAPRLDDPLAQLVGVLGEHLGERAHAARERRGERLVGQQLGASERSAAVHDGSSPTTGTPSASHGAIVRRLRRSTRRAASTWPVEVQVSPQHTSRGGSSTV